MLAVNKTDEYRCFATECLKFAQTAEDETKRAAFLQMARTWFALAKNEWTSTHGGPDEGN